MNEVFRAILESNPFELDYIWFSDITTKQELVAYIVCQADSIAIKAGYKIGDLVIQ